MDDLLPYYEKQLQEFSQQARVFAKKYPALAQRLALNQEKVDDPHIERLIQAFSLIAARIDKKLADSYDIFTHALFEVMFPQYLRHFPACTVVSFEDSDRLKQLADIHCIPRSTVLKSKNIKGVSCEFSTTSDIKLLPLQLKEVRFSSSSSQIHLKNNAVLSLEFRLFQPLSFFRQCTDLPIYLDAMSDVPLQLLDSIFKEKTSFCLRADNFFQEITNPFQLKGFDEDDSLLPLDEHTHHAYRLLTEYFCFPEKFNFLNLNLTALNRLGDECTAFSLEIHLSLNLSDQTLVQHYAGLSCANFKLFCTPAINLFEKQAEPQKLNHQQLEYPLITDAHHPENYQVYSVVEMNVQREKNSRELVHYRVYPFFAMSHYYGTDDQFFYALNMATTQGHDTDPRYSLISRKLEPGSVRADIVSTRLLCSNRNLPAEYIKQSNTTLSLNDQTVIRKASVLLQPNKVYGFKQSKQEQWRIISHLSLNSLALMKGDALNQMKELLTLYDLAGSNENQVLVQAIKDISFEQTHRMMKSAPYPLYVRGILATLKVDSTAFKGRSLYIFSHLIGRIFSLKVQVNSFVNLKVMDINTEQELYQCIQSNGYKEVL